MFHTTDKRGLLYFSSSPEIKNLPASAGDVGSTPWSGKIPHDMGQLGPWATTTEARVP